MKLSVIIPAHDEAGSIARHELLVVDDSSADGTAEAVQALVAVSPATNRQEGVSKLQVQEMGSRYPFIVLYVFLEHHLSKGDYHRAGVEPNQLRGGAD